MCGGRRPGGVRGRRRRCSTREDDANPELLAFRDDDGHWVDVKSRVINEYLVEASGGAAVSAKDFRTWSATVLCAVALAVSERAATSPSAIKRAVTRAVKETADYLGNTPAVCRASYIHPRVIDLFHGGVTIDEELEVHRRGLGLWPLLRFRERWRPLWWRCCGSPQAARAAARRIRMIDAAQQRASARVRSAGRATQPSAGRAA